MSQLPPEKRVIMAKKVAQRWLEENAFPEYRFRVLLNGGDAPAYAGLLKGLRDGRITLQKVARIPDLGVQEEVGSLTVWSANKAGMQSLRDYFMRRGMDTSWIWGD